ncbi:MAG: Ig-like domain-containing protein, partial [Clostridia bacterium]
YLNARSRIYQHKPLVCLIKNIETHNYIIGYHHKDINVVLDYIGDPKEDYMIMILDGKFKATKTILDNGIIGYEFKAYTKSNNYIKVDNVTLNKNTIKLEIGTTDKLTATISPTNALKKDVTWFSNNSNIASIDQDGNLIAKSPGTTQIIVKSVDQAKTAICDVEVIDKVTSITLPKNSYVIEVGNNLILNPTILPNNALNKKYTTTIENTNIAELLSDGRILAKNEGTTKVTLTTDQNNKKVIVNLVVNKKVLDSGNKLNIEENYISKIQPGSKVENLSELQPVDKNNKVVIKDKNGNVISNGHFIGTGTKVELQSNNGTVINTYSIIIYGDIDGDGKIGALDYISIRNNIMNELTLNDVQKKAAPFSKNGNISALDYIAIRNFIMGEFTITQ